MPSVLDAKVALDHILTISRSDFYKPLQIAETLYRARTVGDLNTGDLETYRNPSLRWRDAITMRLTGKRSSSSARYQHDLWNVSAMPPPLLAVLDVENRRTMGAVERYIYVRYSEAQGTVSQAVAFVQLATPITFQLPALLSRFAGQTALRRSIDKVYEIVAYSLFETVVTALGARVRVSVPPEGQALLAEFSELAALLLGVDASQSFHEEAAHLYRVGVTNAADRGLDMWANFGPVVQVKHLTLDASRVQQIVDQVESDQIVIVCRDADAATLQTVLRQIGWGQRVRGFVSESQLTAWYDQCLRGRFAERTAQPLLDRLLAGFEAEFPQAATLAEFLAERAYDTLTPPPEWRTDEELKRWAE